MYIYNLRTLLAIDKVIGWPLARPQLLLFIVLCFVFSSFFFVGRWVYAVVVPKYPMKFSPLQVCKVSYAYVLTV